MRYFLGIMNILGFCDFVIFPNHRNTLITSFFIFSKIVEIFYLIVDVDIYN